MIEVKINIEVDDVLEVNFHCIEKTVFVSNFGSIMVHYVHDYILVSYFIYTDNLYNSNSLNEEDGTYQNEVDYTFDINDILNINFYTVLIKGITNYQRIF